MNQLHVGFNKKVLPIGGCLFIGDDISAVPHKFRPKVFDPAKHSFNPIKDITEAQPQEFAEVIYTRAYGSQLHQLAAPLAFKSLGHNASFGP
jgi:hypothetical protein